MQVPTTGELYKIERTAYDTYQVNQYDFARKIECLYETTSKQKAATIKEFLDQRLMRAVARVQGFRTQAELSRRAGEIPDILDCSDFTKHPTHHSRKEKK